MQALAARLLELDDDLPTGLAVAADMWLAHSRLFGSEAEALVKRSTRDCHSVRCSVEWLEFGCRASLRHVQWSNLQTWTCRMPGAAAKPGLSTEQRTLRQSLLLHHRPGECHLLQKTVQCSCCGASAAALPFAGGPDRVPQQAAEQWRRAGRGA